MQEITITISKYEAIELLVGLNTRIQSRQNWLDNGTVSSEYVSSVESDIATAKETHEKIAQAIKAEMEQV